LNIPKSKFKLDRKNLNKNLKFKAKLS